MTIKKTTLTEIVENALTSPDLKVRVKDLKATEKEELANTVIYLTVTADVTEKAIGIKSTEEIELVYLVDTHELMTPYFEVIG